MTYSPESLWITVRIKRAKVLAELLASYRSSSLLARRTRIYRAVTTPTSSRRLAELPTASPATWGHVDRCSWLSRREMLTGACLLPGLTMRGQAGRVQRQMISFEDGGEQWDSVLKGQPSPTSGYGTVSVYL